MEEQINELEYHTLPNGLVVTFRPSDHKYFVKGIEVPSITKLLDIKYGSNYGFVKPEILKAAADFGTSVHDQLEYYINKRKVDPTCSIDSEYEEVQSYFSHIESLYKVRPIMNEKVVALYNERKEVVACGRFDMLCYLLGNLTLIDFKTTSSINREHVAGQLNLYLTAAYQSGYIDTTDLKLGVIHLIGNKTKFVPITKFSPDFYLQFVNLV